MRALNLLGHAEVEPGRLGDAAHHQHVDVFEDGRVDAAVHDVGHRVGHLREGGERGQDRGRLGEPGLELDGHLGGDGQGPLGADEQLGQVVAARALDELAPGAQDGAVGQHHLEAEHVMARHPVAHGPHAAGVGRHVPAQRAALLARRHRVDQTQRGELAVQLLQCHPRLHHGDLVLGVDLHDPLHAVEGEQDAVGHRHRGAREPGPAAPGDHRDAVLAGQLQDLGHLVGRTRQDDGQRDDRHASSAPRHGCSRRGRTRPRGRCPRRRPCAVVPGVPTSPTPDRSGGPTLPGLCGRLTPSARRRRSSATAPRDLRRLRRCRLLLELGDRPLDRRQPRAGTALAVRPNRARRRTSCTRAPPRTGSAPRRAGGAPRRWRRASAPMRWA